MSIKVQVIFYSMYGHVYKMAQAVVEGAKQVPGAEVSLYQVAELIPDDVLEKYGAKAAKSRLRQSANRDRRSTARRARHHLWHAHPLRQYGRPDA